MSFEFRFHPQKAVEAAALFLKLHGKPMKYLGLLKMLYIADRLALKSMEQPITGDRSVSMKYGPVLSGIYDLIKGQEIDGALPIWSQFISREGKYSVVLAADPGNENLCEEEEDLIREVYNTFGHLDPFTVAIWTHNLQEWRDPKGSAIPISTEEILAGIGKSEAEIEEIRDAAIRESYLDRVLNG